jgi:hypothetical protein
MSIASSLPVIGSYIRMSIYSIVESFYRSKQENPNATADANRSSRPKKENRKCKTVVQLQDDGYGAEQCS